MALVSFVLRGAMNRFTITLAALLLVSVPLFSRPLLPMAQAQDPPLPSERHAAFPWRVLGRDAVPDVTIDPALAAGYAARREASLARAHEQLIARHAGDTRFASVPGRERMDREAALATRDASSGSSSPTPPD